MDGYSSEGPLVSVWCMAYNHERTIADALDSVLAQRCDFPIEVIVADDASGDATPQIVAEYARRHPGVIVPVLARENVHSSPDKRIITHVLMPRTRGRYVAVCEGDDRWTDPGKLARQVAVLEADGHRSMCCHAYDVICEVLHMKVHLPQIRSKRRLGAFDAAIDMHMRLVTTLFRTEVLEHPGFKALLATRLRFPLDIPLYLAALESGQVWGLPRRMALYRIHEGGIATSSYLDGTSYDRHVALLRMLEPYFPKAGRGLAAEYSRYLDMYRGGRLLSVLRHPRIAARVIARRYFF